MPYFSVVLIAHNQRDLAAAAIRSVQAQDDPSWEIVAVDDGSTDGTLDMLLDLAAADDRIRVIAAPHSGLPSITRNVGLEHVTGEVVSFLDGDDEYSPGRFARVRRAFENCQKADVLFGDYHPYGLPKWDAITTGYLEHIGMADRYAALSAATSCGEPSIPARDLLPVLVCEFFGAFTLNVSVRRRIITARRLRFDESLLMAEDHDFIVRALDGGECLFVREVLGEWLRQPTTISSNPSVNGTRDAYQVLRRHVDAIDLAALAAPVRDKVVDRLAMLSMEWGYAEAQRRNFKGARQAYLASLRLRPGLKTATAYAKAVLRLSRGAA